LRIAAKWLWLAVAVALGGCSLPSMDTFQAPDSTILFRRTSVEGLRAGGPRPITPEDLVDADGRCAGPAGAEPAADPNAAQPAAQPGMPLIPSGIALEMTECDVVKRAGVPERVAIGTNERSERTAVLTYIRGVRPGIYNFTAGRLTSLERAPEPPPEPKRRSPNRGRTATR
jgi:hypothetical protein